MMPRPLRMLNSIFSNLSRKMIYRFGVEVLFLKLEDR